MWIALAVVANIAAIISAQAVRYEYKETSVDVGSTALFKCLIDKPKQFDGFYSPKGVKLTNTGRFQVEEFPGRGEYTLQISQAKEDDHGKYTCKAKGGKPEDQDIATLNIRVAIEGIQAEYKLAIGDRGQIKLRVAGYPRPTIYWEKQKNGKYERIAERQPKDPKSKGKDEKYSIAEDGSLSISSVVKGDGGVYRVNAPFRGGVAQKSTNVVTGEKPKLVKTPVAAMNVTEKADIKIDCGFSSGITPTWKHNSTKGVLSDLSTVTSRVKITAESLTISNAVKDDEGTYFCSGKNTFGETKKSTKLEYVIKPATLTALTDVQVGQGEKLQLSCSASGYPTPVVTIHKMKDGKPVRLDGQKMTAGKSEYTVNSATTADRGTYKCTAQNGAMKDGKPLVDSANLEVIIMTKPTIDEKTLPKELKYIMGANETKKIECTAIGYPVPDIKFYKDGNAITKGVTSTKQKQSSAAVLQYQVTGKADLGEIVCEASNSRGNVTKSLTITSINKPGKATNLKVTEKETNYLKVVWAAPVDSGNGEISEYELKIVRPDGKEVMKSVTVLEALIDNLDKDKEYKISVRAKNQAGYGPFSEETKAKTMKFSFPGSPNVNKVDSQLATNEMSVRWEKPNEDGGSAKLTYKVTVCAYEASSGTFSDCFTSDVGTNTSATLKNLKPQTQYKVTVIAHNSRGPGKSYSFKTRTGKMTSKPKPTPSVPTKKERGIGGGAIAGIAIAVFLIVLIVVDLFCCFFNNCGFIHCLYETFCPGNAGKDKYQAAEKEEKELQEKNSKPAAETV